MTRATAFLAHSMESFAIISSVEDRYCAFRFHKVRDGERWLVDIETYNEALFVLDITRAGDGRGGLEG